LNRKSSYAIFSFDGNGTLLNSITTATVPMTYTKGENKISIENALPLEDEVGKKLTNDNQVFDFTVDIKSTGKQTIAYEVTEGKVYYYRLRMWISKDYKVNDESRFFTIKVNVYGKDSNTGE